MPNSATSVGCLALQHFIIPENKKDLVSARCSPKLDIWGGGIVRDGPTTTTTIFELSSLHLVWQVWGAAGCRIKCPPTECATHGKRKDSSSHVSSGAVLMRHPMQDFKLKKCMIVIVGGASVNSSVVWQALMQDLCSINSGLPCRRIETFRHFQGSSAPFRVAGLHNPP